tara:strand:- start:55907 stop:56341 length:435 start_codon:yes stop_codon:yes gene_type:complete
MKTLEAKKLAARAHAGQRYGKNPYTYHLEQVARKALFLNSKAETPLSRDLVEQTALLHDILEYTEYTAEQLKAMGVDEHVVVAVMYLTKASHVPYEDYIAGIKENALATLVKKADNLSNLEHIVASGNVRLIKKYTKSLQVLSV